MGITVSVESGTKTQENKVQTCESIQVNPTTTKTITKEEKEIQHTATTKIGVEVDEQALAIMGTNMLCGGTGMGKLALTTMGTNMLGSGTGMGKLALP
ncbi:hypothetical protein OTU49_012828 [Cherax quadricarinatus]|uniref:Uncharacterized protein n=1 Tax=Cherax quadricarinatus TaxID=27406 RepID=A0AAW0YH46_CHEQU